MKKFLIGFLIGLFLSIVTVKAFAGDEGLSLTLAADSSSGTYKKMLGEIIGVCSDDKFNLAEAPGVSGGSVGNLDALVNNKAQAAFLHSDVFVAMSQADASYKRFKTLVTLYPEAVHVLTLRQSKMKKKGTFGIGTVSFNSLAEIRDYSVGAAGGGVYTLKILKGQGDAPYNINAYNSGKEVLEALDRGDIAAAVFVGAAPLPNLQTLDKTKYKLIPVGDSITAKVKGIYRPATINYQGLTDTPVYTISVPAVILTRKFSTPAKLEAQRHFRQCFFKNLDKLKDDGSPNWQLIEPNDRGVLDWYDIP